MGQADLTEEESLKIAKEDLLASLTSKERVIFQLCQDRMCINNFHKFHKEVEEILRRPVWIHEFARPKWLLFEMLGIRNPPGTPIKSLVAIIEDTSKKTEDSYAETGR